MSLKTSYALIIKSNGSKLSCIKCKLNTNGALHIQLKIVYTCTHSLFKIITITTQVTTEIKPLHGIHENDVRQFVLLNKSQAI